MKRPGLPSLKAEQKREESFSPKEAAREIDQGATIYLSSLI
jgi:hypothetical protein